MGLIMCLVDFNGMFNEGMCLMDFNGINYVFNGF